MIEEIVAAGVLGLLVYLGLSGFDLVPLLFLLALCLVLAQSGAMRSFRAERRPVSASGIRSGCGGFLPCRASGPVPDVSLNMTIRRYRSPADQPRARAINPM